MHTRLEQSSFGEENCSSGNMIPICKRNSVPSVISCSIASIRLSSPLKEPPGEDAGPTIHADFRGNPVGRVPSRGELDVFERAVSHNYALRNRRKRRKQRIGLSLGFMHTRHEQSSFGEENCSSGNMIPICQRNSVPSVISC